MVGLVGVEPTPSKALLLASCSAVELQSDLLSYIVYSPRFYSLDNFCNPRVRFTRYYLNHLFHWQLVTMNSDIPSYALPRLASLL